MAGSRRAQKPKHDYGSFARKLRGLEERRAEHRENEAAARERRRAAREREEGLKKPTPSRFPNRTLATVEITPHGRRLESRAIELIESGPYFSADRVYYANAAVYHSEGFSREEATAIHPQVRSSLDRYCAQEGRFYGGPRAVLVTSGNESYFVRLSSGMSDFNVKLPFIFDSSGALIHGKTSDEDDLAYGLRPL